MIDSRPLLLAAVLGLASASYGDGSPSAAADVPRGYSVPTIDLSRQTERQAVVDREPGQYLGHPTTVLLEDGKTIFCV